MIGLPLAVVAMGIGSGSITSRQPPVKTRAACAARVCHPCAGALVDVSAIAARRATYGWVLSVIYPRLSPRRETDVVWAVYPLRPRYANFVACVCLSFAWSYEEDFFALFFAAAAAIAGVEAVR